MQLITCTSVIIMANKLTEELKMAPTIVLNIGDVFDVKISVADSGNQLFRTIACGVSYPNVLAEPVLTGTSVNFIDGNLFAGLDYEVKVLKSGEELAVLKALKSGDSAALAGEVVSIKFKAIAEGAGVFVLTGLQAIDIENDLPVLRPIEAEDTAPVSVNAGVPSGVTGPIILRIQVIK